MYESVFGTSYWQFRKKNWNSAEAQGQVLGGTEAYVPDGMEALLWPVIDTSNLNTTVRTDALLHWLAALERIQ